MHGEVKRMCRCTNRRNVESLGLDTRKRGLGGPLDGGSQDSLWLRANPSAVARTPRIMARRERLVFLLFGMGGSSHEWTEKFLFLFTWPGPDSKSLAHSDLGQRRGQTRSCIRHMQFGWFRLVSLLPPCFKRCVGPTKRSIPAAAGFYLIVFHQALLFHIYLVGNLGFHFLAVNFQHSHDGPLALIV